MHVYAIQHGDVQNALYGKITRENRAGRRARTFCWARASVGAEHPVFVMNPCFQLSEKSFQNQGLNWYHNMVPVQWLILAGHRRNVPGSTHVAWPELTLILGFVPVWIDGQTGRATHRAQKKSSNSSIPRDATLKKFNGRSVPKLDLDILASNLPILDLQSKP